MGPFSDQVIETVFLLLFVLAITDVTNLGPGSNMAPFLVGMAVVAIEMSFGTDAGYAINPAHGFGPWVLTWLLGWGHNAFAGIDDYWWVPIGGPLVGAAIAVGVYRWWIEDTIRARARTRATASVEGRQG